VRLIDGEPTPPPCRYAQRALRPGEVGGSYLGSSVPARDIPRFVALHQAGRLPVDRLLTHRLRLGELNEGFDRLARGEAVRQAVIM
jgi:alcohol dehydrogenase